MFSLNKKVKELKGLFFTKENSQNTTLKYFFNDGPIKMWVVSIY